MGATDTVAEATAVAPAMGWMKTFLGACVWAFMIAAGSLVYNHFVGKWQEKGYPILPMAAMAVPDNHQPRGGPAAIPLHGSRHQQQQQQQPNNQQQAQQMPPSYLDQYEG